MQASSDALSTSFPPLANARAARDKLLYTNENSIYVTARAAKEYYKGLYGVNSPQFKQISGLEFNLPGNYR
jgi:hypothetical protein